MDVIREIGKCDHGSGVYCLWEDDFEIWCQVSENFDRVVIKANVDGLKSLANHCLTLAQDGAPYGAHIHLDVDPFELEPGSIEMILGRLEED